MTSDLKSFEDFGIEEPIVRALRDAGISTPFPIQELTLPLALTGADIIGQARTGTGKTLAFGIPLLAGVDPDAGWVQALVVVPTRELCLQVTGDLNQAGVRKGVDVVAVYGGRAIDPQVEAIESGASVVVGTPGRLLDLMRRGNLDLSRVTKLVLDEADEMLDLGFLPDVEQLIEATAAQRQTLLFSATMPSQVVALARRYMSKPTFLRADIEEVHVAPETTQYFFSCHRMDKPAVLARILQSPNRGLCVVFTRTKRMADILAEELRGRGVSAAPIHSNLRQEAREKALARFRRGKVDVLVATEVAARGLDITDVTHVVNYDCPDDEKMYLHRIGRTGRAGAAGVAITLAVWNELARLEMIKRALDITDETHEVFSTSPILDELFDLPPRAPRTPAVDTDEDDEDDAEQAQGSRDAVDGEEATRPPRRRRRGGRRRRPAGDEAAGAPDGGADATAAEAPADAGATPADAGATPAHTGVAPADAGVAPADAGPGTAAADTGETRGEGRPQDGRSRRPRRAPRENARSTAPVAEPAPEVEVEPAVAVESSTADTAAGPAASAGEQAGTGEPQRRRRSRIRDRLARAAGELARAAVGGDGRGRRPEHERGDADPGDTPSPAQDAAGPAAREPVEAEGTAAGAGDPDGPERRVRVRRRTARGGEDRPAAPDERRSASSEAGRPAARGSSEPPASGGGQRAPGRQPASRQRRGSQTDQRGRSRRTSASRGRRERPSGRSPGSGRSRPLAPRVDADTARGSGKPTLHRPLVIEHLP